MMFNSKSIYNMIQNKWRGVYEAENMHILQKTKDSCDEIRERMEAQNVLRKGLLQI